MGIRLTFLGWWTPKFIISRELDNVSDATTTALVSLLKTYSPNGDDELGKDEKKLSGNIENKRVSMAKRHAILVEALVEAIGKEEAVKLGREKLFEVGRELGTEIRSKLGVTSNPQDLVKAAKVLYRVLGIDFDVNWVDHKNGQLLVQHCELAKVYSELTCLILSATDEGVINGLEPSARMLFKDKITEGCSRCIADIRFS